MNLTAIFEPRRFSRLMVSDAQNVSRDPILILAIVLSLLPGILLPIFRADIDAAALAALGIPELSRFVGAMALALPAFLIGWVTGFLLLEDRDDGPLMAMEITPVGKGGFLTYRVTVTALVGFAVGLMTARLVFPELTWPLSVFLAVLVGFESIIVAFILLALASNKVEGLAITKLTNIGAVVPLIAALPSPWRYLGGLVPSYWFGELVGLSPAAYLPLAAAAILAVASHLLAAMVLFRLIANRVG